jgi:hypothetical protein
MNNEQSKTESEGKCSNVLIWSIFKLSNYQINKLTINYQLSTNN